MKCLTKSSETTFISGNVRISDLLGTQPCLIKLSWSWALRIENRHRFNNFISQQTLVVDLRLCFNFNKCCTSMIFKSHDTLLSVWDIFPSAYKNPNQYAFSSVSILSKKSESQFGIGYCKLYFLKSLTTTSQLTFLALPTFAKEFPASNSWYICFTKASLNLCWTWADFL